MVSRNHLPDSDIEREQLIKELAELRSFTSGFLSSVSGALIVLDNRWRLYYLNDEAKKLFEGDEASLMGKALEEIYPKKLGYMLSPQFIQNLLNGKEKSTKKYTNYLNRWFKITAHSSDFGIFIRLEDVSSEMLTNRLLRLNEFSLQNAIDMVFWAKVGGHIIYSNKSMCDTLGYHGENITRMMVYDIDLSNTASSWKDFVNKLKNKSAMTYESRFRDRNGSQVPVEINCKYLYYHGDEYIVVFARDITLRKKIEKDLKVSKAESELYVDLMGHDINNMNQVATGYLELALDRIRSGDKIDIEDIDLLSKPYEMLLNSSKLIENVRKVQREKAGSYETRAMEMRKVLEEVKNENSNVAGREITIDLVMDGECKVGANDLLKDIFTNLVGNSIKHSSGPLSIKIEMSRIAENGRSFCRIAVEDNGPGIPDGMKYKLINRLSPENIRGRGKGFGLYLIKQLVTDFNGKFWMEDRIPGDYTKGARFVVMLPALG